MREGDTQHMHTMRGKSDISELEHCKSTAEIFKKMGVRILSHFSLNVDSPSSLQI